MKGYRFTSGGKGVYEAVDLACPRDDKRRELKPDGSWLPKIGKAYPGSVSYWTEYGLNVYLCSGLQEWHRSVLEKPLIVEVVDIPEQVLYRDQFQFICSELSDPERSTWGEFCERFEKYPVAEKVVGFVINENSESPRVLVFEHEKKWSDAGLQVPAGSVRPQEPQESAICREIFEETGLESLEVVRKLGDYYIFRNSHSEFNHRHVFELRAEGDLQEEWEHKVSGHGHDRGMTFKCFWLTLDEARRQLAGSLGCLL